MTQEDKDLLLKDLCARLPYRVKCQIKGEESLEPVTLKSYMNCNPIFAFDFYLEEDSSLAYRELGEFKPYLFPLSNMTEEQKDVYHSFYADMLRGLMTPDNSVKMIEWLNAHHFDFRNLIGRNLAIDCTNLNIY